MFYRERNKPVFGLIKEKTVRLVEVLCMSDTMNFEYLTHRNLQPK